jgi:hypothetical protein
MTTYMCVYVYTVGRPWYILMPDICIYTIHTTEVEGRRTIVEAKKNKEWIGKLNNNNQTSQSIIEPNKWMV